MRSSILFIKLPSEDDQNNEVTGYENSEQYPDPAGCLVIGCRET
jgi:hypothetical protein